MSSSIAQTWNSPACPASDEVVDHRSPTVRRLAQTLGADRLPAHEYAQAAFTYVRDRVDTPTTPVIPRVTGICHAKAHTLWALLRAGAAPAGLCCQRLRRSDEEQRWSSTGWSPSPRPAATAGTGRTRAGANPAAPPAAPSPPNAWRGRCAPDSARQTCLASTPPPPSGARAALRAARDRVELSGLLPAGPR
ncbi:hypothetical protein [Streptomyces sp. BBFR102]|uniref:hypothetical protein n=1 Tax=Streptomyces sp. BBFR102 TaxID=3448171 RepID=UPI003F532739